jgi:hypothetical protein
MKMGVPATAITDMIVADLNAIVAAVGTTSLHENVIAIEADPVAVQWTHVGHSVLISAVSLHTAGLAVPSTVAAGTMNVIIAVDLTDSAEITEITAAEPVLSTWPPGVYVSVNRVSIVIDQIVVIQVNDQSDSERLRHRLAAIHRQS